MNTIAKTSHIDNNVQIIDFHGQQLMTMKQDDDYYTAMKPICENIGLDWNGQFQRIKRDEVLSEGVCIINIPSKGGEQDTVCLPIKYLNGWLFGVDVKRVKPEIQDTLIMYKKECYQVLHDYWHNGVAINPRPTTKDERTPLKNAVNMLVGKTNLSYSEIYKMVHQYMGVTSITDIPLDDLPKAVEYVHKLTIQARQKGANYDTEYLHKMYRRGMSKTDSNDEVFAVIQKALTVLGDSVKELQKNNATHYSVFESLMCQTPNKAIK